MKSNNYCFVIMPFGTKEDSHGEKIDFDQIYRDLIKPAVTDLGIKCIRCDEIGKSGSIHKDMFNHIYSADIAIVDISVLNPNVFYELGIRHSLKKSVTVLLKRKGTRNPFNISGMRSIDYDETDDQNVAQAQQDIRKFVESGLRDRQIDSPVFDEIENLTVRTKEKIITKSEAIEYKIRKEGSKSIAIQTGNLDKVKNVDIWVNSENTNMQMAKYFSGSISGIIRYLGAKKDITKNIVEDTIQNELTELMGQHNSVVAGAVIPTSSGALEKTHNVRKIFHAASVVGNIGKGYSPIVEVERCITEALVVSENMSDCKSIIFPVLGAGGDKAEFEIILPKLINAVVDYFEENPECCIDKVYFLVRMEGDFEIAKHHLEKLAIH